MKYINTFMPKALQLRQNCFSLASVALEIWTKVEAFFILTLDHDLFFFFFVDILSFTDDAWNQRDFIWCQPQP